MIAAVAMLALATIPLVAVAGGKTTAGVTVRSPGGSTRIGPAEDRTLEIEGARGSLTVEVSGGRARVVHADCPDQVCVRRGWSSAGSPVVCAPNRVVIESGTEGRLDAVSR